MKKTFESLKIWRILPALLFFMTCGVFITYTVKGDFYGKYSTNTNNILTDAGWNYLMNDLDNLIPAGTIMAFARESCPEGWTLFTGANGRFLMGASYNMLHVGGTNSITLTGNQLPPHQHYLRYGGDKAYDNPKTNYRSLVVDWNGGQYPWDPENTNYSMSHGAISNSYYNVSTAPYGNGWGTGSNSNKPINIQNPYIKVLYCIKGQYTPDPDTYTVTFLSNGHGYVSPGYIQEFPNSEITLKDKQAIIGDKIANTYGTGHRIFDKWSSTCGNKLLKDCTITASFKKDYHCAFNLPESCNPETTNCESKCISHANSSACVSRGTVSQCNYFQPTCDCR